jgi:hypothetical protein
MRNDLILVCLSTVLGIVGNVVYDDYVQPRLYYTETKIESKQVGHNGNHRKYTINIFNSGIRPAEDITCRISIDRARITQSRVVVNGESKAIKPDYPNAVLDKINYLNRGKFATYEIDVEGPPAGELYVLVIGKGVQAEKQTPAPANDQNSERRNVLMLIVFAMIVFILVADEKKRSNASTS